MTGRHPRVKTDGRAAPGRPTEMLVLAADLFETGGIGTVMRDSVRALVAEVGAAHCHVMTVRGNGRIPPGLGHIVEGGVSTPSARIPLPRQISFGLRAMMAAWRYRGGLVVLCGHPNVALVAWVAGKIARAPVVAWVYGKEVWAPLPPATRRALGQAQKILAITRFTADLAIEAQGLDPAVVSIVPLAVSTERRLTNGGEEHRVPLRVLSVARLNHGDGYKGVDRLLEAWPRVLDAVPGATLHVVGDGDDRPRLEGLTRRFNLGSSVRFLGRVSDEGLDREYEQAVLFALPGRATLGPRPEGEGFGLVFIEAAAAGLPCVAGRAGGAVEAVIDGVTGLLVDPEDPADVARKVLSVLMDDQLRQRLAETGRCRATTEFSFHRFSAEFSSAVGSVVP